jgi:phytol kinase
MKGQQGRISVGEYVALFVPDADVLFLVAPLALACALALAVLVGRLRLRRGMPAPYTRKLFHFAVFTLATVVQLVWGLPGVVVFGSVFALVVAYAVVRGDGFPLYEALARPTDAPRRGLFVAIPLATTALGGIISNVLFLRYAYIGYLVCGWGDAVGEPVGTRWGRHRYRVPSLAGVPATRSVEGSIAVFLVGSLAAFIGLLAGGFAATDALRVAAAAGAVGAAVEAISTHGLDNLTVQVAAAAAAYLVAT